MQWNVEAHHGNCNTQMQESFDNAKSKSVILKLSHNTPSYFMVEYPPTIKLHTKSNDTNEHPSVSNPTLHHEQHAGQALLDITARKRFYRRSQEQRTVHLTRNKSSVLEQTFSARLDPRLPRSFHSTRLGGALACRTPPNSFDARRRQKARVCTFSI